MQFFFKLLISIAIIVFCTQIGRKFPSLGGLIATMPLTGVIVLVWLYSNNPGKVHRRVHRGKNIKKQIREFYPARN